MRKNIKNIARKINSLPWWEKIMIWYTIFLVVAFPITGVIGIIKYWGIKSLGGHMISSLWFVPISFVVNFALYLYIKIAIISFKKHFILPIFYFALTWKFAIFMALNIYLEIAALISVFTIFPYEVYYH